ncbi:hypothetical protein P7K49_035383, partial [Saguinus oedipus]
VMDMPVKGFVQMKHSGEAKLTYHRLFISVVSSLDEHESTKLCSLEAKQCSVAEYNFNSRLSGKILNRVNSTSSLEL